MSIEIVCGKCGQTYSFEEYSKDKFCSNCGTFLTIVRKGRESATPKLKITRKRRIRRELKKDHLKLRTHPIKKRMELDQNIAYFLGLLLARGEVKRDSFLIKIPCRFENAIDHREFLVNQVLPRLKKGSGERINISKDFWNDFYFHIEINSEFFNRIIDVLEIKKGQVCRTSGVPYEIFNSSDDTQIEFLKGIGDCCGEIDRYFGGKPRVVLRFLNENTFLIEDVVEVLVRLSVPLFDVNLSPPSPTRKKLSNRIYKLSQDLTTRYGVNVTGRSERIGRDNMVRMWAEEYNKNIGFDNRLRQEKLMRYIKEFKERS